MVGVPVRVTARKQCAAPFRVYRAGTHRLVGRTTDDWFEELDFGRGSWD
jgi:hypothetical protein